MRIIHRRRWCDWRITFLALALAAGSSRVESLHAQSAPATAPTPAQSAPAATPEQSPPAAGVLELDLFGLLQSKDVLENVADDSIWEIKPTPGRRLIQIPLNLDAGKGPCTLDSSSLKIRGARFLVFKMTEELERAPRGSDAARQIEEALPDEMPRMARKIVVDGAGKVRWSLDRSLTGFGGAVKPTIRLYALKLDSKLLESKGPGAPPKVTMSSGESARAFQVRRSQEEAQFRARAADYREIQKRVRDLPDDFAAVAPKRIWAVFEVISTGKLEILGPPPLPWTISLGQLEELRAATKQVGGESAPGDQVRLPREVQGRIAMMSGLMADAHPYTARAVAFVLAESNVVRFAQVNDTLYKLLDSVLHSSDTMARRLVIRELARVVPPSAASLTLLKSATREMDPTTQLLSLRTMLKVDMRADSSQIRELQTEANRFLTSESGPPAGEVVQSLIDSAGKQREMVVMLGNSIRFEDVPEKRRDAALIAVIENAPSDPLAAFWLDQRLLASSDAKLVRRTLELIVDSTSDAQGLAPVAASVTNMIFGRPAPTASTAKPRAKLNQLILVDSPNHGLFHALQSGAPEIRSLAWEAAPHFAIASEQSSAAELSQALLATALNQSPTPTQAVDILARQKDPERIAEAMVRIVVRGSPDASRRATRAILASKGAWPIGKILQLSFDERQEFVARFYENITGKSPLAAGLLRLRTELNPLLDWLTKEFSAGNLPALSEWVAPAGGEDRLLDTITSSDPELARGAMAVLVASAGGDDRLVPGLTQRLSQLPDTRLANLQSQWAQARRDIYAARLQNAAGAYQLILMVADLPAAATTGPSGSGTPPAIGSPANSKPKPEPAAVKSRIALGAVQLQADGQSIRLANQALNLSIPDNRLAIRIDHANELKNFPSEQLLKIPLEKVTDPVDLLPQTDASWRGSFDLPDGRKADLILQPGK